MIHNFQEFLNEHYSHNMKPHKRIAHIRKWLTDDQIDWCNYHIKFEWLVNDKGEVYTPYALEFQKKSEIEEIPVQLADMDREFNLSACKNLVSLKGSPKVARLLDLTNCSSLASLEGGPVDAEYVSIQGCPKLVTLKGAPLNVKKWEGLEKSNISKDEIALFESDPELFEMWLKSGLDFEEWKLNNRGRVSGRRLGL